MTHDYSPFRELDLHFQEIEDVKFTDEISHPSGTKLPIAIKSNPKLTKQNEVDESDQLICELIKTLDLPGVDKDSITFDDVFPIKGIRGSRIIRKQRKKLSAEQKRQFRLLLVKKSLEMKKMKTKKLVINDHDYLKPQCPECGMWCERYNLLRDHLGRNHNLSVDANIKCGNCSIFLRNNKQYYDHLKSSHDIDVKIEKISFYSEQDLTNWLNTVNKNKIFSRQHRSQGKKSYVEYFKCKHSGNYRPRKYKGMRMRNNIKIDAKCPASIKIERPAILNGTNDVNLSINCVWPKKLFLVTYISAHVGHDVKIVENESKPLTEDGSTFVQSIEHCFEQIQQPDIVLNDTVRKEATERLTSKISGLISDKVRTGKDLRTVEMIMDQLSYELDQSNSS